MTYGTVFWILVVEKVRHNMGESWVSAPDRLSSNFLSTFFYVRASCSISLNFELTSLM